RGNPRSEARSRSGVDGQGRHRRGGRPDCERRDLHVHIDERLTTQTPPCGRMGNVRPRPLLEDDLRHGVLTPTCHHSPARCRGNPTEPNHTREERIMANIFWKPAGDAACYGTDVTPEQMEAMDALTVEYITDQGHHVTVG